MNNNDPSLSKRIAGFENLADWCAWLVVLGLVLEVALAAGVSDSAAINKWGLVGSDALVAFGVAGEILFSRRARSLSEREHQRLIQELSGAKRQAEAADKALVRYRRPRLIFPAVKGAFVKSLLPFAGVEFDIGFTRADPEQAGFVWTLEAALAAAGWNQIAWTGGGTFRGTVKDHPPGTPGYRPEAGEVGAYDVSIQMYWGREDKFEAAIDALITALAVLDIDSQRDQYNIHNPNNEVMHIIVGRKK